MPDEPKVVYLDPQAIVGALTPKPKPTVSFDANLGPSEPHDFAEELEVGEPVIVPGVTLSPGAPPPVAAPHYTAVLDELWPEFDDPEERTAARLKSLFDEVSDEALRIHLLAQDVWEKLPAYKLPVSERERLQKEILAYARRLNEYRKTLAELEPDSLDTESVYIGLVKRRPGAGPVPDAIMHLYFAQQLGILSDHADEMGEGFVGRVLEGLETAGKIADEAKDAVKDAAEEAADGARKRWWDEVKKPWLWAGGAALLGGLLAGGTVALVKASKDDKP